MRRFSFPRRMGALLGAAGLVLAACGEADQYAAVVNGSEISVDSIQDELEAIEANEAFVQALEQAGVSISGEGDGTFRSAFVAQVLTRAIAFELVDQELAERDAEITEADRQVARENVASQVGGPEVFDQFSEEYQRSLTERTASVAVLQRVLGESPAGADAARQYYEDNREQFQEVCLHHILVDTAEEAQAIIAEVAAGAEFEAIARERSIDTGSGSQGGDLGCAGRGLFVPEFEEAAFAAPVGQVTGPVETSFGFHVIRVDDRRVPPFEEVEQQVQAELTRQSESAFGTWIQESFEAAEIEVNPRFGRWATGLQPGVVPPDVPTTVARGGDSGPVDVPIDPLPVPEG